jgi:hypothetical protein
MPLLPIWEFSTHKSHSKTPIIFFPKQYGATSIRYFNSLLINATAKPVRKNGLKMITISGRIWQYGGQ